MFGNPIEDLEHLLSYLSMTDKQKREDLVYDFGYFIVYYTDTLERILEDDETPESVRRELKQFDEDDYSLSDLSDETFRVIAREIDPDEILAGVERDEPAETPLWSVARLNSDGIVEGWLVHQSDAASDISYEGFKRGVDDLRLLALTTHLGDAMKSHPGYNFAYEPGDYERYGTDVYDRKRYGKSLVLFKAPFVSIWHTSDLEPQAIFWGPDATDIHFVFEQYGTYSVDLEDDEGNVVELEADSLEDLIDAIEGR